jgi:FkbM family methyltransferase
MTYYWDDRFLQYLDVFKNNSNTIFEVGARYGDESIELNKTFKNSNIYSFECNPLTVDVCRKNLEPYTNIKFFDYGLGNENEIIPFYSYIENNDGCSSFYKRIDFTTTQRHTGNIRIRKMIDLVKDEKIDSIDLLCMDVQGYELNILKGA